VSGRTVYDTIFSQGLNVPTSVRSKCPTGSGDNKSCCIVDFNHYVYSNGQIFIKELAIYYPFRPDDSVTHMFQTPDVYDRSVSSKVHQYNTNILHPTSVRIPIDAGDRPYRQLQQCLAKTASESCAVYVHGKKKRDFVCGMIEPVLHQRVYNIKPWMKAVNLRTEVVKKTQFQLFESRQDLQLCSEHKRDSVECGVVTDYSPHALKVFCRQHQVGSFNCCPMKRAALVGMYVRRDIDGCRYIG